MSAESSEKSYYDILGVKYTEDATAIKKAWHRLCLKYHPDRAEDKAFGEKMTKEINEAYSVLSDQKKRAIYDKFGKKGLQEEPQSAGHPFQQMFMRQQQDIIPPIQVVVRLPLDKLYSGTTINQPFERKNICKSCDRTGTKDKSRHPCNTCKGRGIVTRQIQQGNIIQRTDIHCPACKGARIEPGTPLCSQCNGELFETKKCFIKYDIPPGCYNGATIEIPDFGDEIPQEFKVPNRTRGNLILVIQELPHDVFIRTNTSEADLAVVFDISLAEALCGFKRSIAHLDGRNLAIVEHEGVVPGQMRIIKGEGMPKKSNPMLRGNLIVKFMIHFPKDLKQNQKRVLYACLNGGSLEDVDFTVPSDHVMTNLLPFSETDIVEDEENADHPGVQVQQCRTQ
ncbi:DnaJ molecular chaperone [uncultured virus]|nr:DnaJ molecular chaperone [uncultured virus]